MLWGAYWGLTGVLAETGRFCRPCRRRERERETGLLRRPSVAADVRTAKIGELEKAGSVFSSCWAEVIVLTLYLLDTCMYIQKNDISEQQRSSRSWTCE